MRFNDESSLLCQEILERYARGHSPLMCTLMLVVIVGISVLALDGARLMALQTQLQAGADAMALAGAAELDRLPDSMSRATNAINNLVSNPALSGAPSSETVQVFDRQFLR